MDKVIIHTPNGYNLFGSGDKGIVVEDLTDKMTVSDGHHTMDELYEHRSLLFCAFLSQLAASEQGYVWRSKLYEDGTMYNGWFIAGAAQGGALKTVIYSKLLGNNNDDLNIYINPKSEISYHLPLDLWDKLDFAWTLEKAIPFDGYSPKDVLDRMRNYYI